MNQNQDWNKTRTTPRSGEADERMRAYLEKIATGPRMSKDLTEAEAEDGLSLVLDHAVSEARAAVFLIASRMKIESIGETRGFYRALDATTLKREVGLDRLLQVADAFDGFVRAPQFGFYTIPVLAQMGLPAFALSALPTAPKHGVTCEDLLIHHYGARPNTTLEERARLIEQFGFGYLGTEQCHPKLEGLRGLREEVVKRTTLATLEKMLMPLKAQHTFLASNYFHPGYETAMIEVAKISGFDRVLIGNGMEGSTLYGVHKQAKVYMQMGENALAEMKLDCESLYDADTVKTLRDAFTALKDVPAKKSEIAQLGEQALQNGSGPATPMIAHHAATLSHLSGHSRNVADAYHQAIEILKTKNTLNTLKIFIDTFNKKK
ncbi:hypothetical protein [Nitrospina watsonii]|uniref:Glycosyl transferase family, helical bundle domain protein n=1 Tax=Nitrospina watsonii TaxID=1323948 RepID=A0ABM9HGW0_9BACT|nr:hypothetical protein [Nitrospina watsonii]CAI2719270.1 Putative Glycosyl transferase family, helical bundle domain protein [Nitrospina watsonii]